MIQRREVWERAVAMIEGGATTRSAVSERRGVSELSAVSYWVMKLRRERSSSTELLPVRVIGQWSAGCIEVRVGDVTVSVREGVKPEYVADLVRACVRADAAQRPDLSRTGALLLCPADQRRSNSFTSIMSSSR